LTRSPWRPAAAIPVLELRARLLGATRAFFAGRGVMEVTTPVLGSSCAPELGQSIVEARFPHDPARRLFLQPSPEAAMKRLLAAGSGPIYQIGPAFRAGEQGERHNPEFCMLEWYRPGFSLDRLAEEVDDLLWTLLDEAPGRRTTYRQAFLAALALDPLRSPTRDLESAALESGLHEPERCGREQLLDLLFSHRVAPALAPGVVHVFDFPASQAAMAKVRGQVCRRVETYVDGVELANGYEELTDPHEQRHRFEAQAAKRRALGAPELPVDESLLAALAEGLPECCGVALGFDRLMMRAAGASRIEEVIAFPIDRA
jgi:lysyl-tRNA synthetase class 2